METPSPEVTALLHRLAQGDKTVITRLMPLIYDELHRRATAYMREERSGHTLQPTALVHETYLKLVEQRDTTFKNRAHFMAVAAKLMRRILIDHARARLSNKRGGGESPQPSQQAALLEPNSPEMLLAVNQALSKLQAIDPRQEEIVEMRFFGGLTVDETAEVLGISTRTVEREWTFARAWLYRELKDLETKP
jgi:RNA polymerase sigma factor (TIGR02999 family)